MSTPARKPALTRTRRPARIDGLKVRIIDDPAAPVVDLGHALRLLARMLVRAHEHAGDRTAIIPGSTTSSTLTVVRHTSPDHETHNEAA